MPKAIHPSETRPQPTLTEGATSHQAYDGGFYFSPVVLAANKGGSEAGSQTSFRSYATAT
jgi:hypothetical protein